MPRLINADALKTVLCASKCGVIDPARCECGCMDVLCIDDAPTIDELEKRNEPIKPNTILTTGAGIGLSHCPKCGESIDEYHHPSFCGACGQAVKWK